MFRLTELPKRPWKNFEDYLKNLDRAHHGRNVMYPCMYCNGFGKVRRMEDRDPIEGFKLAPWYKCTPCDGTGNSSRMEHEIRYKNLILKWKEKYADAKAQRDAEKSALKRIKQRTSKRDRKILQIDL